jgi:fumarate reductase subunit C
MTLPRIRYWKLCTLFVERIIAAATLIAVLWYGIESIHVLVALDWSQTETFYEFINRTLIAIIGLELVHMLVNHSIGAVLELLAFVIARKMLKPDLSSVDIALSAFSFAILMVARHYCMEERFSLETKEESVIDY